MAVSCSRATSATCSCSCSTSSWPNVFGAFKDSLSIWMAQLTVYRNKAVLKIALIKATTQNHPHIPPKTKHVEMLIAKTSSHQPNSLLRTYLAYCISKRLRKTQNWIVVLKTEIVIHQLIQEVSGFAADLKVLADNVLKHHISNFNDNSSTQAVSSSSWIRNYSSYLAAKIDLESKKITTQSNTVVVSAEKLLEHIQCLQDLLDGLLNCIPTDWSSLENVNPIVKLAFKLIMNDSFEIYTLIALNMSNLPKNNYSETSVSLQGGQEWKTIINFYNKSSKQTARLHQLYAMATENQIQIPLSALHMPHAHSSIENLVQSLKKKAPSEGGEGDLKGDSSVILERHPWVRDELAPKCAECYRDFNLFRRKHHCRFCGEIFCEFCSRGRISMDPKCQLERVCDTCLEKSKYLQEKQEGK